MGVMPEKAFKMQGWVVVGGVMEQNYKDSPMSTWLVGGAAAGALTALIGEWVGLISGWWAGL